VGATRLADLFFYGIVLREVGVAQKDAVFRNVGGGLCQRTQRGDSGVQDIEPARPVMCEGVDDVGEHGAGGLETERSRSGIIKEGRVKAVIDGGSNNYVLP